MRKAIIAGNWKMNMTRTEATELVEGLKKNLDGITDREIIVCPPFTSLCKTAKIIEGSNILLGAQNVYFEPKGAYTGEIAPNMLKEIGCKFVIIGHSERRSIFKETSELVNKKLKALLSEGLNPIVCVGETLEEKEKGITQDVIKKQVTESLAGLNENNFNSVVLAYEPVWAIGTGKTATPEQAEEVHEFIRQLIKDTFSEKIASELRLQYGGSVKGNNIDSLMAQKNIDGALVGGAALKLEDFTRIVKFES